MSRIGNRILTVPDGVTVTIDNEVITVKGPKGELSMSISNDISVIIDNNEIKVTKNNETKKAREMHGTTNALIANMLKGVKDGFEKSLEIIGVGYRFDLKGKTLEVRAGHSNQVLLEIPEDLTVDSVSTTEITVKGIDKAKVGKFAAEIRKVRKPEPYKGKGIRYKGERIRRKEGKKASK